MSKQQQQWEWPSVPAFQLFYYIAHDRDAVNYGCTSKSSLQYVRTSYMIKQNNLYIKSDGRMSWLLESVINNHSLLMHNGVSGTMIAGKLKQCMLTIYSSYSADKTSSNSSSSISSSSSSSFLTSCDDSSRQALYTKAINALALASAQIIELTVSMPALALLPLEQLRHLTTITLHGLAVNEQDGASPMTSEAEGKGQPLY